MCAVSGESWKQCGGSFYHHPGLSCSCDCAWMKFWAICSLASCCLSLQNAEIPLHFFPLFPSTRLSLHHLTYYQDGALCCTNIFFPISITLVFSEVIFILKGKNKTVCLLFFPLEGTCKKCFSYHLSLMWNLMHKVN